MAQRSDFQVNDADIQPPTLEVTLVFSLGPFLDSLKAVYKSILAAMKSIQTLHPQEPGCGSSRGESLSSHHQGQVSRCQMSKEFRALSENASRCEQWHHDYDMWTAYLLGQITNLGVDKIGAVVTPTHIALIHRIVEEADADYQSEENWATIKIVVSTIIVLLLLATAAFCIATGLGIIPGIIFSQTATIIAQSVSISLAVGAPLVALYAKGQGFFQSKHTELSTDMHTLAANARKIEETIVQIYEKRQG